MDIRNRNLTLGTNPDLGKGSPARPGPQAPPETTVIGNGLQPAAYSDCQDGPGILLVLGTFPPDEVTDEKTQVYYEPLERLLDG